MKNITHIFAALAICLILAACQGTQETLTPEIRPEVQHIQLGNLQVNIMQDPQQVRMPVISLGDTPPGLGETAEKHYAYPIYTEPFSVDFSQFTQVHNAAPLREVSNLLSSTRSSNYIILYLTNTEAGLPDEDGLFNMYSTSVANTYLLVDQREMAATAKVAKITYKVFEFSYIEVIGDVAVDFAEESLLNAILWIKTVELQEDLLEQQGPCSPGIHWSCASFHIVDQNGNGIAGATLELYFGSPRVTATRQADEAGYVTIPLNAARNKASTGDFRKFHEYDVRAYAEGYGTWDSADCKIFSAPNEAGAYSLVLPEKGKTNLCSGMEEIETEGESPAPVVSRIIPPDFHMKITQYIEEWEWQSLQTQCIVETEYHLLEMLDERTAVLEDTSRLVEARRGDCSSKVEGAEQIKVDVFTGARLDSSEPSLRFAGAQSQPSGSSPSLFNNVSVWWKTTREEIPWQNNQTYAYDQEHYIDQFTGIRIYRTVTGSRKDQGVTDDGYCRWQQDLSLETNAPIAGNSAGYYAEYPQMKSGCAGLESIQQPPAGDPCIVMQNYYNAMNQEDPDLFYQNFITEGWSSEVFKKEYDWHTWYFGEYDVRYSVNACTVEWKASAPPFSAILNGKVHSESVYKGNSSQSDLDVRMYAVYRNGAWSAAQGYSVEDSTAVTVPFINSTEAVVEVFWIDYEKNERKWFELQPGEKRDIGTAVTHVWALYDQASGQRLAFAVIFPNPQPVVVSKP